MPKMVKVGTLAANTKYPGIFQGEIHEYVERPSIVKIYLTASAEAGQPKVTVNIGNRLVVNDQQFSQGNHFPIAPDDLFWQGGARSNDRIVVDVRNGSATAIVTYWCVCEIIPVR